MVFLVGLSRSAKHLRKNLMKQIQLILISSTIIVALSSCSFENRKIATRKSFRDLGKHIQDALRNLPIDTFGCYPDLIDLTGHYKLTSKEIGPWCYAQKLENTETGKTYWFEYNTPRPFIVTSKEIIFPTEYNIITMGIEQNDKFNIVPFN